MKAWDDSAAIGEEQKTKVMLGIKKSGQQQQIVALDRKSTRLNSSHSGESRMPSSA